MIVAPDEISKRYYASGVLRESTEYKNSLPNGEHREYFENGNLGVLANHVNGKYQGAYKEWWWNNNNLREQSTFVNGKLNGRRTLWREDGTVREQSNYKHGKLHGEYKDYYPNGKLCNHLFYVNNTKTYDLSKYSEEDIFRLTLEYM